jgi:hypothetical protein
MLMRRVKRLRLVTRAVTVIQFAAVTFVPVVHPYLHHEPVAGSPTAGPLLPAPHHTGHLLRIRDECLVCSAQPGIPPVATTGLEYRPHPANILPLGPSDIHCPIAPYCPANSARAPPRH